MKYTKKEFKTIVKEIITKDMTQIYSITQFNALKDKLKRQKQTRKTKRIIDSIETYQNLCKLYHKHKDTLENYNGFNRYSMADNSVNKLMQDTLNEMYEQIIYENELNGIIHILEKKRVLDSIIEENFNQILDNEIESFIQEGYSNHKEDNFFYIIKE